MRATEDNFRVLFDSHPAPMWVYDLETLAFLEVNDSAMERYGYSRAEFLAMTIREIRPSDEVPELMASVSMPDVLQRSGPWIHRTKDGTAIEVEITSHALNFGNRKARFVMAQDLTERRRLEQTIKELSTPVLPLRIGLLLLPLIGVIDSERARQLTEQLLEGIRTHRAKVVVIDLTGVPAVDSAVANHLLQTVRAAKLLGASAVVTGISAENAQTLTRIGVDLSGLVTTSDLQSGIDEADRLLSPQVGRHTGQDREASVLKTQADAASAALGRGDLAKLARPSI